jgi:hypothetical protein
MTEDERAAILRRKRQYAVRRASLAVDRLIRAKSADELTKATRWANVWGKVARLPASERK